MVSKTNATDSADVLVIGAGAAGLGAARSLHDQNFHVIVLEGRERIGGRVWTDHSWPDVPLDMGASWIHGVEGNPIAELAEAWGIETAATDYGELVLYDTDGRRLSDNDQEEIVKQVCFVLQESETWRGQLDQDESPGAAIANRVLASRWLSAKERRWLDYGLNTAIEQEYAADVDDLSLFNWNDDEDLGGEDVIFPGGYDQIIKGLAQGLDICLQHMVSAVEHDQDGVRITTSQGKFTADHAIVTLPLGVLQQGSVAFSPALPAWKMAAIHRLGMGVLNKLYLRFPHVFWPEDAVLLGYISHNKGEWAEYLNLARFVSQPILACFNAGRYGRATEDFSDEQLVGGAMQTLRTIFGRDVPDPDQWHRTRWAADPLAFGSYSYLPPGASGDDREALARPVGGRLFFAGEATSRQYAATVHGAYLSGLREARRIVNL